MTWLDLEAHIASLTPEQKKFFVLYKDENGEMYPVRGAFTNPTEESIEYTPQVKVGQSFLHNYW